MKKKALFYLIIIILISMPVFAAEGGDVFIKGLELDKVLNFGSALLATILFILIVIAYNRNKNQRLLYVSIAFLLFAVKGYILSLGLLLGDLGWVDPVANLLDFAILLSFFFGIIKK